MFGRNQMGRNQIGGAGLGFRGISPPWPYIGRGRGGLPRCGYYSANSATVPQPNVTREQEISLLKSQKETMKRDLEMVESRIGDLEKEV